MQNRFPEARQYRRRRRRSSVCETSLSILRSSIGRSVVTKVVYTLTFVYGVRIMRWRIKQAFHWLTRPELVRPGLVNPFYCGRRFTALTVIVSLLAPTAREHVDCAFGRTVETNCRGDESRVSVYRSGWRTFNAQLVVEWKFSVQSSGNANAGESFWREISYDKGDIIDLLKRRCHWFRRLRLTFNRYFPCGIKNGILRDYNIVRQ